MNERLANFQCGMSTWQHMLNFRFFTFLAAMASISYFANILWVCSFFFFDRKVWIKNWNKIWKKYSYMAFRCKLFESQTSNCNDFIVKKTVPHLVSDRQTIQRFSSASVSSYIFKIFLPAFRFQALFFSVTLKYKLQTVTNNG